MSRPDEVTSHWHYSAEDFNVSALEFYHSIETTLFDKSAPISPSRVDYLESGILSEKREYLRISYGRYSFDICAAPFGSDFFFSWWLVRRLPNTSFLYGCFGLMLAPVAYVIILKMTGLILGTLLFLAFVVGGIGWLITTAQSGSQAVEDAILGLPVVGSLYLRFLRPVTYYAEDSRTMFEETVHRVVVSTVNALLAAKGARQLAPDESKPERVQARK